jgi:hypothetical protein
VSDDADFDTGAQHIGRAAAARIVRDTQNEQDHWAVTIRETCSQPGFIRPRLHGDLRNAADEFLSGGNAELSKALNRACLSLDSLSVWTGRG